MVDWNQLLSYNTVKIVTIRDWRLGCLHYFFILGIVLYIGGWTIGYQERYLVLEQPVGTVRLSLMQGAKPTPPQQLPYCLVNNQTSINNYTNYPCVFFDAPFVVFPITEQSALLATTRLRIMEQFINCSMYDPTCAYQTSDDNTYYIADIERFTVMIDHTMYAPHIGLQYNAKNLSGELVNSKNEVMHPELPDIVGQKSSTDILQIKTLLEAAGIESLDGHSQISLDSSMRYDGIVLLVFIEYSNTYTYNLQHIKYSYHVHVIRDTEFKSEQPVFTKNITTRVLWDRHGIRMIFLQGGTLGKFDFQVMLVTFVSGIGLFAISTVVVDIIAIYLLHERKTYTNYKYELTKEYQPPPPSEHTPLLSSLYDRIRE